MKNYSRRFYVVERCTESQGSILRRTQPLLCSFSSATIVMMTFFIGEKKREKILRPFRFIIMNRKSFTVRFLKISRVYFRFAYKKFINLNAQNYFSRIVSPNTEMILFTLIIFSEMNFFIFRVDMELSSRKVARQPKCRHFI